MSYWPGCKWLVIAFRETTCLPRTKGYTFSLPTIALSNVGGAFGDGNRWVTIFGSRINNTTCSSTTLLIMTGVTRRRNTTTESAGPDVQRRNDGGRPDLVKTTTDEGTFVMGLRNVRGKPVVIDEDRSGAAEYAYASDRNG